MLFRDVTAMLMKPVMSHTLREPAKLKIPLVVVVGAKMVGSVTKTLEERPEA